MSWPPRIGSEQPILSGLRYILERGMGLRRRGSAEARSDRDSLAPRGVLRQTAPMRFIGVDCGTSALKAVLVDERERVVASAIASLRAGPTPHPLWSEQDPDVWRDAMFAALVGLARASRGRHWARCAPSASPARCMGSSRSGPTTRPLRPAILHNDGRAHAEAAELHAVHGELERVVGVKAMASFPAAKMLWLQPSRAGAARAHRLRARAEGLAAASR